MSAVMPSTSSCTGPYSTQLAARGPPALASLLLLLLLLLLLPLLFLLLLLLPGITPHITFIGIPLKHFFTQYTALISSN